ncbi:gag-pol polyprotein [Trichonephila clavipes]|nr:gag-pol polyprotein [Trichonephila clavipes]
MYANQSIGVDFLKYFNLLVDAKHHRVIDANTKLSSNGQLPKIKSVASNLAILVGNNKFDKVLKQYPELINPSQPINVDTSNQVYHHIETKGPPVFSKLCRLTPTILKAVKKEFEYLMAQGIIRLSKSHWASPLHVVKISNGECRDPVVITVDLIQLPFLTAVQSLTFKTTLKICMEKLYSLLWIWVEHIIK